MPPGTADPIGAVIETLADPEALTGSVSDAAERNRNDAQRRPQSPQRAPRAGRSRSRRADEPLRRRMLRALLYGKADRHAKARGRIGLAMIAFTAVYAIIAGRLVLYAMTPDSHGGAARQRGRRDRDRAARHPRPQRRDAGDRRAGAPRCSASRSG